MKKSIALFLRGALIVFTIATPMQNTYAQGTSLPAEMNQAFTPISIPTGGVARLRVAIFNPNSFALTNASWTNNLIGNQPGLVIASPVDIVNTCGGFVTAVAGTTTFSLSGGTVPGQAGTSPGSCSVSINVTSTTVGNLINTIPAGALSALGGGTTITNTDPASATLHVGGVVSPSISKRFSSATIWAGEISRLSIMIANNDPSTTLTQVSVTDDLPADVLLADPVAPSTQGCGASAAITAAAGGSSMALSNGTIPPNSTCTITVNVTSGVQGNYTNRIPANALQTQQGLTNPAQATTRLRVQEVGVSKRFSPSTFAAGSTTTLIITLQNPTATAFTGTSITDNLPAPLTVVGLVENTCGGSVSTTSTSVTLRGGTIPPGSPATPGNCRVEIEVTAPAGTAAGSFRNTIATDGLTTDQGIGNLRPAIANVVVSSTEVAGIKSFSPSTIEVGGNSRLRIDIFAPSDTALTGFSITDNLPTGITVSNSTLPAVSGCGAAAVLDAPTGATTVSLSNGEIAAGRRCRIELYVTSNRVGSYTNTISPSNITNNENRAPTADLTSSLRVRASGIEAIALVKGFDPLTVFGGSASTMSVQLLSTSSDTVTDIAFTDNMPAGMILASPLNFNAGDCSGTLSGTPGENSFSFSGGSLPPFGSCTLTLSATMNVNGNLTNIIPASAVTTATGVTNGDPAEASLTNLPGVSISKFFASNPITPGSDSALNITIQNTGNIALDGLGFSDSLPVGLLISGGSSPAPVNDCGGTLTAVADTQLIQLVNGSLDGSASCTIVVHITGDHPGEYTNTVPLGALTTDSGINVTNSAPATDTLVIRDDTVTGGGGGGGRGRSRGKNNPPAIIPVTGPFFIPVTGFAPNMVTKLDRSARPLYETTSLTLEIPVIKVRSLIVGVESKKGGWDVTWLQDQVGWLNGTAYPTWKGNSLLTAHVVNADGKPGIFSRLKYLGVGEYVFVYSSGYRYTYKVIANDLVQPNDSSVMRHEEQSVLTLITCESYDETTGTYLRRVAVRAELINVRPVI